MRRAVLTGARGDRWELEVPTTRRERMRGLRGRETLPPAHGFLIPGARSVQTFGMRFPITAVFLDRDLRVVACIRLPPGRVSLPRVRARHVLECPAGTRLQRGERLRIGLIPEDGREGAGDILGR